MKKYWIHFLTIFLIILIGGIGINWYYYDYSIKDNTMSTQKYLIDKMGLESNSTIKQQLYLQNYKIVLFNYKRTGTAYALLKKGINNKYKIMEWSVVNQCVNSFTYNIGGKNYFICLGYNKDNNSYLQLSPYSNFSFNISNYNMKDKKYFIIYKEIDSNIQYYRLL